MYFWLHWVFVAVCRFSVVAASGDYSCCGARASHCGFSCCGAWALGTWASVVVARGLSGCGLWALECRLSICGSRALLLRSMWDLPRPGIEPMSPALAGGFFNHWTTREDHLQWNFNSCNSHQLLSGTIKEVVKGLHTVGKRLQG